MTGQHPVPCERCGQPHARCAAHKRDGGPCGQPPMRGQRVCKMHGGKKPAAVANAERKQQEAAADAVIRRRLWNADAAPVTDPVLSLQRLAGVLEAMLAELGTRVEDLTAADDPTRMRADVALLERLIGHLRQILVDMARLGLEDRVTAVLEAQGEQVYELVRGIGRAVLAELVQLLADHPGALSVLESEYERVYGEAARAELGALHELEVGRAS